MGSLYVVSGRTFTRSFTISSSEDPNLPSTHHQIEKVRLFLDNAWPMGDTGVSDTQNIGQYDGRIGDIACIVVVYTDSDPKKKVYKRNFGVDAEYTWTEEVGSEQ